MERFKNYITLVILEKSSGDKLKMAMIKKLLIGGAKVAGLSLVVLAVTCGLRHQERGDQKLAYNLLIQEQMHPGVAYGVALNTVRMEKEQNWEFPFVSATEISERFMLCYPKERVAGEEWARKYPDATLQSYEAVMFSTKFSKHNFPAYEISPIDFAFSERDFETGQLSD